MDLVIAVDDPRADDVRALLGRHVELSRSVTPPDHAHVLDVAGLSTPDITFFSARRDGVLVAVGALRELDPSHGELKSMHTDATVRGEGIGHAMVHHLLGVAEARGYVRVSLETGTMDAFAAARSLYASVGFRPCPPFGAYTVNPYSTCMTLELTRAVTRLPPRRRS
ncbi:MAG TPA: GNAT family N-acetyltransferase [Acidimicrobiia bacterium]|nr:GNAT family N-acetyltransferase [Acidimicrobiia bacterium]